MAKVIECDQCGDKISGDYLEITKVNTAYQFTTGTVGVIPEWPKQFHAGCVAKWAAEHYAFYTKSRFDPKKYLEEEAEDQ